MMGTDPMNMFAAPNAGLGQEYLRDNLALAYQEILTVITRMRTNRQAVMDAPTFRTSMKAALTAAEADATRKGYTPDDAHLATFAVVAFLDESAENLNDPNFTNWARLQEEMFGDPASGEIFFQCIARLLARDDSPEDADVLEVFALCLLLGYQGQDSSSSGGSAIITKIADKIQRTRGPHRLAPDSAPLRDAVLQPPYDPWVRALVLGTLGAVFLAALFFAGFKYALASGASELHSISQLAAH
jgi:type VI secretion system protein ImpK